MLLILCLVTINIVYNDNFRSDKEVQFKIVPTQLICMKRSLLIFRTRIFVEFDM